MRSVVVEIGNSTQQIENNGLDRLYRGVIDVMVKITHWNNIPVRHYSVETGTSQEVPQCTMTGSCHWFSGGWPLAKYWMLQNFSPEDLVGEEQWLEGESTNIQCAYGEAIAYPSFSSNRVENTRKTSVSKCCSIGYSLTTSPGWRWCPRVVGDTADKEYILRRRRRNPWRKLWWWWQLAEFNFDDEFFSQDKLTNPKLIRSLKHQAWHEHVEEQPGQKAGLGTSVAQFCELQESDPLLEKFIIIIISVL